MARTVLSIARAQRILELEKRGMTGEAAINETVRHQPDYRIRFFQPSDRKPAVSSRGPASSKGTWKQELRDQLLDIKEATAQQLAGRWRMVCKTRRNEAGSTSAWSD